MRLWYNNVLDSTRYVYDATSAQVRIGRGPHNDLVLNSPYVCWDAALIHVARSGTCEIIAIGELNELSVSGTTVEGGSRAPLSDGDVITIFPFSLTIECASTAAPTEASVHKRLELDASQLIVDIHRDILEHLDLKHVKQDEITREQVLLVEKCVEDIILRKGLLERATKGPLISHIAGTAVRSELLGELMSAVRSGAASVLAEQHDWSTLLSSVPEREMDIARLAAAVKERLQPREDDSLSAKLDGVERGFWTAWRDVASLQFHDALLYAATRNVKKELKDILFGYGPLEDLLRAANVSEIMVVDREHIYVEKNGVLENSGRRFISDDITRNVIERIVARVGRSIDYSNPLVDARLADGSRVNAIIPPIAVRGPCLTIRKFPQQKILIDDLISFGALTHTAAQFLRAAVIDKKNIIVSGGTGTGKTTLLNCLSDFIPDRERIVTVEDTAELQLKKEHVVSMEAKQANLEGKGEFTISRLVKNALRMRPDRIVVGECRGSEALDMLQAMNTGHSGSLTTIHANSANDVVLRLEVLVQLASSSLPVSSIHRQISSAIDLIVQVARFADGKRRVTQISEVLDSPDDQGSVKMCDVFAWSDDEAEPALKATGYLPSFMEELTSKKLLDLETFY